MSINENSQDSLTSGKDNNLITTNSPKNQQNIILSPEYLSSLKSLPFTQRFKILIFHRGFKSHQAFARALGITQFHLSHIVTGRNKAYRWRSKICELLNISEKDLWNGN